MNQGGNKEKQSEKISEETNMKKQYQTQAETLLSRLHLQDKHQQRFSTADFLQIGPPVKQDQETCEKDLAHTFLHRLMILDYRARYIPVRQDSSDFIHSNSVETDDSDLDVLYSTSVHSNQSKQSHVHPMDVQMAVFHCSDSFFKQNMITKLSQCQYAVPLLVPHPVTMDIECPLWTFRQIRKTWKITQTKDNSNTVTMKSMPICNAETSMVSFFRLGSLSQSKSHLMNTLINDRHNTFFHRNCPGSTKSRYLMDGVAEIAWYCPAGKPNDAFTDCIVFCNLHGDALLYEKQRDILTEKSSVNVVFVPTLEEGDKSSTVIEALFMSAKPLIILIADNDSGAVQMTRGKYKMGLNDRRQSDVSEELKGIIRNILSGPHASFQLETMTEVYGIRVDEDDALCQKGKSAAERIEKLLQGMDCLKIKDTFLQCQGQLWSKWCRTNKELYRLTGDIEREKSEKQQELKQIRQDQCKASCSELMKSFVESLSSLKLTDREYFLKWTQILIDALCTDDLSSILQSYDDKWSEVLALKEKHDKSDQLKMKHTELEQISSKLQSAHFGLEHMFREMGQINEAHKSLGKQPTSGQTDWSKYPELAAELMISGHPMELMDGDTGHVPLTWISSLLDEVINKLGNKRVFVLSVLGVQSSGKSTMLNAMFGVQFAVSAGRCTKGAFMQLVRVSEEIKKDFQFDYILVVDTEGLRALELEGNTTLHHDNELATFVVGLGNMTLINIFGENPADMQDVLQIVVQAFMRMKQVKLSPSCVFIHQNVSDIAATEMNMEGKRRLQEKLDQMAKLAAKEEGCDAECFSDVITFDVQKDVKYFAQLWEGSPPMAPPNPGYSESIQELKTFILSKASQSEGMTLKQFKTKIHDLWNALLNENFVFSFKNTHEIAVYRKLEAQYGDWTWTLRSNMLTIENQLFNKIESGKLIKLELSYLYEESHKTYEEIKNAVTTYFDDDSDKEMLAQWRGRFESKIKKFHDEQVKGCKRKLDEVIQQKKARKKLDEKKTEFENKLLQKSKDLAHELKHNVKDEKELDKQFTLIWRGCVTELTAGTIPIKDINYEDQSVILQELGFEWSLIDKSRSRGSYKKISEVADYSHYIARRKTLDKVKSFFTWSAQHEEQQQIRSLIDDVEKQSLDVIKTKPVATQGYSPAYLQEVANKVKEKVTEFESTRKYALKKEFTVDLVLYVFDRAEGWLTESHKKFKTNNDALVYFDNEKEQYYNIFRSFCKRSTYAVVFGELICEKLKRSTVEAVCNNSETLLSRLRLQDKYQQKFSPADLLQIGPPVKQDQETCEKDLAHTFLHRLMILDYRARYIPVRQDGSDFIHSNSVETDDSDLDVLYSTSVHSNQSKQSHVHPMDVQMAVFHCSDSFFKQNMITKLSQCQYAVPLLVPDLVTMDTECPLWTFRKMTKTWKITQTKDKSNIVTLKSMPICTAETPMVSFFRLGSLSQSKSQLMNTLINDRHNTFFHRNCPGSTTSHYLMDGVAEIAWYCPAGKPNDAFTDCIAFCNLHGDALLNEKQRDILTEKSSVNVVLVPTLEKGDKSTAVISALYKSAKPLIILIVDEDLYTVEKKGKYKMGLKDRSQSDVSEELRGIIRNILSGPHTSFQLETMAEVSGIRVDEDDALCQKGKSAAERIEKLLQGMDGLKIKDTFLQCQGQLWSKWCRTNKELYRLTGDIERKKSEKQQELKRIRQDQCKASCSELMKPFIESLSSLKSTDREYFLKWTQILIDALCTDGLSSILQSYDDKWSEVLSLMKKHDKSDQFQMKHTELEQISSKLQSAHFGLEHMFREMGQIYEAHKSLEKQPTSGQTDWSKYPELAAELMISGHPMELMDGDTGHVPLTWISGLLDEVINKLGNKRVFVLSVLGLQSSGKSTMLNAMFGLQFAVSAGRCTKGAFMQLVRVSEEIKKDFQFDYVLVVDTEGLRALELEGNTTLHHDNELATFVVGLGNMTLINIFGENPADMQDVLQIVLQAFMRMKKVKLSPSCVFVHQNVSDIAASEMNMEGKRRLQEKLDQMAQLAAKEEGCDAECFSDVIAFDVQKDVKYFAQLWEGSPPMASPNPGYSESIQELKTFILFKASQSEGITLEQFKSKIHDLWNALLNENFVFSFKNTHEIAVYRKLEAQYGNWTWTLRSNMLTIENQLYNKIETEILYKIELSYLSNEIRKSYEKIHNAMTTYFDDDRDKEMLAQWRCRFGYKIKEFHDEQVRGVKRKLDEVIQQKKACKKLDDKKTEFENKLLQKSKDLAHQLKDMVEDVKELDKQFTLIWSGWVSELTAGTIPIKDINYEDQSVILQELGFEWSLIDKSRSRGSYKKISEVGNYSDYVASRKTLDKVKSLFTGSAQHEEQQQIGSVIDNIVKQSLDVIKTKPVATQGYNSAYLQEVANKVKDKVTEFESTRKYALKKEFIVDLVLYVFDKAKSWLTESHKTFKENNDAHVYIKNQKGIFYNTFQSFCKGSSSAVVLGELICEKLKSSTIEAVCNKTAIDLAGEMKCNVPAFSGNRLNLEKHVLRSLAEKENFDGFITYIQHPRKQVEKFIEDEVNKYILYKSKGKAWNILKKNVEDIKHLVSQALFSATEKIRREEKKTEGGDIDKWVKTFSSLLDSNLKFNICCQNFSDINNFDFLEEEIQRGLKSIMEEMSSLSLDKMNEFRLKPDQILIDQLCNCCWVTCPFCAAVCTNTVAEHSPYDHSTPFHRPAAVLGGHYINSVELDVTFCTTRIGTDERFHLGEERFPYNQYRTAGPRFADWSITPDSSKVKFWTWFVCRFKKELEDHYKLKFQGNGEIPNEWKKHTKKDAIESLDEMFMW